MLETHVEVDAETGRLHLQEYVAGGDGGRLVTGTLMDCAVQRAAERVRRALRPSRDRQTGEPA